LRGHQETEWRRSNEIIGKARIIFGRDHQLIVAGTPRTGLVVVALKMPGIRIF